MRQHRCDCGPSCQTRAIPYSSLPGLFTVSGPQEFFSVGSKVCQKKAYPSNTGLS